MITSTNLGSDPARIAHLLIGERPQREVVLAAPDTSLKWHMHHFPAEIARWNHHPEIELHLIQHSHGSYVVGDYMGEFAPGNLCLIGPDLPHHWISSPPKGELIIDRDVVLQFDGQAICKALHFLPEISALDNLFMQAARGIEFLGETRAQAIQHLIAMGSVLGIERLSLFFRLFSLLAQAPRNDTRLLASTWFRPNTDPSTAPVIDKVLNYIIANQDQEIRMSAAARMVGMSNSGFSRFFKEASGRGFAETVRALRVVHACRLLRETTKPVSEICFATGFENLSNFNRRFREAMGRTPSAYRAEHRVRRSPG